MHTTYQIFIKSSKGWNVLYMVDNHKFMEIGYGYIKICLVMNVEWKNEPL